MTSVRHIYLTEANIFDVSSACTDILAYCIGCNMHSNGILIDRHIGDCTPDILSLSSLALGVLWRPRSCNVLSGCCILAFDYLPFHGYQKSKKPGHPSQRSIRLSSEFPLHQLGFCSDTSYYDDSCTYTGLESGCHISE